MDVLEASGLAPCQCRADVHVVKSLSVHVICAMQGQSPRSNEVNQKGHILGVSFLNREPGHLVQVNHLRDGGERLHRLHKGKLVEVARGNDICVRINCKDLGNEGL